MDVRAAAVTTKGYNTLGSIGTKISDISHFFECVLNVLDKSTQGREEQTIKQLLLKYNTLQTLVCGINEDIDI